MGPPRSGPLLVPPATPSRKRSLTSPRAFQSRSAFLAHFPTLHLERQHSPSPLPSRSLCQWGLLSRESSSSRTTICRDCAATSKAVFVTSPDPLSSSTKAVFRTPSSVMCPLYRMRIHALLRPYSMFPMPPSPSYMPAHSSCQVFVLMICQEKIISCSLSS